MLHEQQSFRSEFVSFKALRREGKSTIMLGSDLGNVFSILGLFCIYGLLYFTLFM